eukprot:g72998.t1
MWLPPPPQTAADDAVRTNAYTAWEATLQTVRKYAELFFELILDDHLATDSVLVDLKPSKFLVYKSQESKTLLVTIGDADLNEGSNNHAVVELRPDTRRLLYTLPQEPHSTDLLCIGLFMTALANGYAWLSPVARSESLRSEIYQESVFTFISMLAHYKNEKLSEAGCHQMQSACMTPLQFEQIHDYKFQNDPSIAAERYCLLLQDVFKCQSCADSNWNQLLSHASLALLGTHEVNDMFNLDQVMDKGLCFWGTDHTNLVCFGFTTITQTTAAYYTKWCQLMYEEEIGSCESMSSEVMMAADIGRDVENLPQIVSKLENKGILRLRLLRRTIPGTPCGRRNSTKMLGKRPRCGNLYQGRRCNSNKPQGGVAVEAPSHEGCSADHRLPVSGDQQAVLQTSWFVNVIVIVVTKNPNVFIAQCLANRAQDFLSRSDLYYDRQTVTSDEAKGVASGGRGKERVTGHTRQTQETEKQQSERRRSTRSVDKSVIRNACIAGAVVYRAGGKATTGPACIAARATPTVLALRNNLRLKDNGSTYLQ